MQDEQTQNPEQIQEKEVFYPVGEPEIPSAIEPVKDTPGFFVFNSNTILGFLLLVGVIILFILHFNKTESPSPVQAMTMQKASGKQLSVVYVNIDSLNANYDYVRHLRSNLEATGKRLQTEVLSEQSALEKEAADFQKQVAANIISEERAKEKYEILMQKQQTLMLKKEKYTQQIAEQEMDMNVRLVDTVTAFLKRFNRDYHFDYIMGFKAGGEIFICNDTLDITPAVLDGLNKELEKRKK